MTIQTKLPGVGVSIFAKMSALANEYKALNLSQGFPGFSVDPVLIELVNKAMQDGKNQYAPMPGLPILLERISEMVYHQYKLKVNPQTDITICSGATEALFSTMQAIFQLGDTVILLDPCYDSYEPAIQLAGAKAIRIPLEGSDAKLPRQAILDSILPSTRGILINNPHNPLGTVLEHSDMQFLENLSEQYPNILFIFDEVYEQINFQDGGHISVLQYPNLYAKSIAIYSFGKTFHATGWKMGYVIANAEFTKHIRTIHQFVTFAVNTPIQWAIAEYLNTPSNYLNVASMYRNKRDFFNTHLENSAWKFKPAQGSYFQILDYSNISQENDVEFAERLVKEHGIATVPTSVFYAKPPKDQFLLRVCFAKEEAELLAGTKILNAIQ